MELLQLIYFCDAAKTENFSQTAKKFHVPPSAISQSVHRLETELSTVLFYRDANRVKLNSEGKLFYDAVKDALTSLENAKAKLEERKNGVCGEIRLFIGANRRSVTLAIEKYRALYPRVSFLLNHSTLNDVSAYDLVISHDLARCAGMERRLLRREKLYLAMSRMHPLADRERLTLSDCAGESFVSMHEGSSLREVTETACKNVGFLPKFTVQSDDPAYVRKYVELGMGVVLAPEFSWDGQFSDRVILRDVGEIYRDTYLFFHHFATQPLYVRRFAEMLVEVFEE
ncbi:MAG: LysR family transcriptional regulator [Clostridia bacterium]|nr:LysR family transcriptional regulator [Clostridia bacterium]